VRKGTAAEWIPPRPTIAKLRSAAMACRACHLWTCGTETVFGEGTASAEVVVVGEIPGDKEDLAGRPFVGPAGALLDAAFEEAGIDRTTVYLTNVVKHFKWERAEKGKRRIHKTPNADEIRACRPWMDAELALIKPRVLLCLGAIASKAILGAKFKVTVDRGKPQRSELADVVIATVHPASVLRAPDAAARARAMRNFKSDIRKAAKYI
jgi:uracil-DNA glycosylase